MPPCADCALLAIGQKCEKHAAEMETEENEDAGGGARARSKSPLMNSGERPGKTQRATIHTPLAAIPGFPAIIPGDKGKGDKGKGGVGGKAKGGKKGDDPWNKGKGGVDPWSLKSYTGRAN